jgi:hypothetical protein
MMKAYCDQSSFFGYKLVERSKPLTSYNLIKVGTWSTSRIRCCFLLRTGRPWSSEAQRKRERKDIQQHGPTITTNSDAFERLFVLADINRLAFLVGGGLPPDAIIDAFTDLFYL